MTGLKPAVFLDRDGVLNEVWERDGVPHPPQSAEEVRLLPGVGLACRRLRDMGYVQVVVTNQPDIARGKQTAAEVERIHAVLRQQLPIDDIVVCPHDDIDGCVCRKPQPGMLLSAADRLGLDLSRSYCVGDRWRDVDAGKNAGVKAIYVDRGYGERKASGADAVVPNLLDAVSFIELANF